MQEGRKEYMTKRRWKEGNEGDETGRKKKKMVRRCRREERRCKKERRMWTWRRDREDKQERNKRREG